MRNRRLERGGGNVSDPSAVEYYYVGYPGCLMDKVRSRVAYLVPMEKLSQKSPILPDCITIASICFLVAESSSKKESTVRAKGCSLLSAS